MTPGQQWLARLSLLFAGLAVAEALATPQWGILETLQVMPSPAEEAALAVQHAGLRSYPFIIVIAFAGPVLTLVAWLWVGERFGGTDATTRHLAQWSSITAGGALVGALSVYFLRTSYPATYWTVPLAWTCVVVGWAYCAVLWTSLQLLRRIQAVRPVKLGPETLACVGCLAAAVGALPLTLAIPVWAWARARSNVSERTA